MQNLSADVILQHQLSLPLGHWVDEHVQPSSWRLSGYNVGSRPIRLDYIATTETLDKDWPAIVHSILKIGSTNQSKLLSLSLVNVGANTSDSKLSRAGVRAMCKSKVYQHEWECFGYEVPEECKG